MVYHIFNYCVQGVWYRDGTIYSDDQFDRIMDKLAWRLPANMRVYHYGSPGSRHYELTNPVVLQRPVLSLDPLVLVTSKLGQRMAVHDKRHHLEWPVISVLGRFLVYLDSDNWPRFCYADGGRFSLNTHMEIIPISFREAKEYVRQHHRHCTAPQGHKFSIGLKTMDGVLIGVAIASIPKARALNDGRTLEINRVCCDPAYHNTASKLYGAAIRTGKAMGYRRFVTYTLPQESGSSVRAAGFQPDGTVAARTSGWNCRSRPRPVTEWYPLGEKIRWVLKTE